MPIEKQFIVNHQKKYAEAFVFEQSENERKLIAFVDCEAIRNYQVNQYPTSKTISTSPKKASQPLERLQKVFRFCYARQHTIFK